VLLHPRTLTWKYPWCYEINELQLSTIIITTTSNTTTIITLNKTLLLTSQLKILKCVLSLIEVSSSSSSSSSIGSSNPTINTTCVRLFR